VAKVFLVAALLGCVLYGRKISFQLFHFPKTNAVLFPPKAKEFERAMATGLLRAWLGT
jgi:hypothetical protein